MRKDIYLGVISICLVIGSLSVLSSLSVPNGSSDEIVQGTGEVVFITIECGFYAIISDDGKHLVPNNIPLRFCIDGIRVLFAAKIKEMEGSFIMYGQVVELRFILFIGLSN